MNFEEVDTVKLKWAEIVVIIILRQLVQNIPCKGFVLSYRGSDRYF